MTQWASGDSLTPSMLNLKLSSAASSGGFSTNTLVPESGNTVTSTASVSVTGTLIVGGGTPSTVVAGQLRIGGGQIWSGGNQFNVSANVVGTPFEFVNRIGGGGFDSYVSGGATLAQRITDLGQALYRDGTAVLPTVAYSSESSLGFYRSAASTLVQSYGTFQTPGTISTNSLVAQSGNTVRIASQLSAQGDIIFGSNLKGTGISVSLTSIGLFGQVAADGTNVIAIKAGTAPSGTPASNGGILCVRAGALLFLGGSGSLTTVAPA